MRLRNWPRWQRWLNRRIPPASSVELSQRRVFILPTRQGGAFGLALLVMLLAAINYQNSLAYALAFLLIALALVTLLHTWRNLAGLQLRAAAAEAAHVGQSAGFHVLLESRRPRPAIALGWVGEPSTLLDVPAGGALDVPLSLAASRRGWLRAPRLRVETRFPLGLWVAWSWVDLQQRALVYPRPAEGLPTFSHEGGEGGQARPVGEGLDDFRGLRPYQPADGRRRLDWKAYARGQGLRVKDFAAQAGDRCLLDLAQLAGPLEERLANLCAGVLRFSEQGVTFELRLATERLGPAIGRAHRDACLRALALYGLEDEA